MKETKESVYKVILTCALLFSYIGINATQKPFDWSANTDDPTQLSYFYGNSAGIEDSLHRLNLIVNLIYFRFDVFDSEAKEELGYDLNIVLKFIKREIRQLQYHLKCKGLYGSEED